MRENCPFKRYRKTALISTNTNTISCNIAAQAGRGRSPNRGGDGVTLYPRANFKRSLGNLCHRDYGGIMTVHFIGAGPGPQILLHCAVVIWSRPVPCVFMRDHWSLRNCCPLPKRGAYHQYRADGFGQYRRGNSIGACGGQDVRLHSGDLSVWSAMGEQLRRIRALDIPVSVTPVCLLPPLRRYKRN